jgi:hypothetical protein
MARHTAGGSRRKRLWVGALLLLVSLATLPVIAPADGLPSGSGDPNYLVYGGCGTDIDTPPAHLCHKGDRIGAFFRSNAADVTYDVCVRHRRHGGGCAYGQAASKGVLYVSNLSVGVPEPTVISWKVNGGEIGTWLLDVYPDPVVSKFGVNPLIVSRTHRLFGLVLRHVAAGARVRAWRKCPGLCPLRLRLTSVRGETRRYEMAGSPVGSSFALGETLYVQVDAPGKSEHGYRIWGRLYKGELVRNPRGGPRDTAVERVGELLCTPPGSSFRAAATCAEVAKRAADYPTAPRAR